MSAATKEEAYKDALSLAQNGFYDLRATALAAAELLTTGGENDTENAAARVMRCIAKQAMDMADAADVVGVAQTVA